MSSLLMNRPQQCCVPSKAPRPARRKALTLVPMVPLVTRLLVVTMVGGALALLLGLAMTTRTVPAAAGAAAVELPRVVVTGKRIAGPAWAGACPVPTDPQDSACPVPLGAQAKEL